MIALALIREKGNHFLGVISLPIGVQRKRSKEMKCHLVHMVDILTNCLWIFVGNIQCNKAILHIGNLEQGKSQKDRLKLHKTHYI
jgi:hypothetical protein